MSKKTSRKHFLNTSLSFGIVLTLPQFLETCQSLPTRDEGMSIFADAQVPNIWKALYAGSLSPNPHNTQAWKFKVISERSVLLFVDESRILAFTDPSQRQIHIGQGCFIECFKMGASSLGFETKVTYFPEGEYKMTQIGKKPVAKLSLEPTKEKPNPLFQSLQSRTTNRSVYSNKNVKGEDLLQISGQINSEQGNLIWIPGSNSKFSEIQGLLIEAFALEINLTRTNEESRIWFRTTDSEIYKTKDGISLRGNGMSGLSYFFISKFFVSTKPEDWHSDFTKNAAIDSFRKQVNSAKAFGYIKTPKNSPRDWVNAGESYARVNLLLNEKGYAIHPLSQILQEYPEMDALRLKLEKLLEIPSSEKIQMLFRIGRSDYHFQSPRRDISNLEIK